MYANMGFPLQEYRAAILRERRLERGILRYLNKSLHFACQRFGDDYAFDYLMGLLDSAKPRQSAPGYRKVSVSAKLRWAVFKRDDFRCKSCGSRDDLAADHIFPEVKGGPTSLDNLQTLCRSCNSRKKVKTPEVAE